MRNESNILYNRVRLRNIIEKGVDQRYYNK